MRYINLLITISFFVLISCKKSQDNKTVSHKLSSVIKASNDTLNVETDSVIIFLTPSNEEIEKIKKEKGEESFYTIADDENNYQANIDEILEIQKYKTEITEKRFIKFNHNKKIFDKNNIGNKWAVIIYIRGKPLKIISSVDFYIGLNEFKGKNEKIDYNSILENIGDNSSGNKEKSSRSQENNLNGVWRIDCSNDLTILDISNSIVYISIYSNSVYINAQIESIPNEAGNYYIKFLNQEETYESDGYKIDVKSISKEKSIGKLEFKNNKLMLYWYGLFNEKTKKLEFDKNTPFDIEGENKNPGILTRCK